MHRVNPYFKIATSEYFGVSPNTLREWADEGRIATCVNPANQYRLFRQDDLGEFLNSVANTEATQKVQVTWSTYAPRF